MIPLTYQERQVLLFVSFLLVLGLSLGFWAKARGSSSCLVQLDAQVPSQRFDINQATPEELISLPGIGEKTAANIIRRREVKGNFTDLSELKEIRGMTQAKLDKLKGYLYISKE